MTGALRAVGAPVLVCLGAGGVGKTSIAAALGLALAEEGHRVVVLTIDPARRLADALGLARQIGNEPHCITGVAGGRLWACMLDPAATFADVVAANAARPEQAQRIVENRLFGNLVNSLSGTGEYMAAERLHHLHQDPRFDVVVVDTPPSKHAFDFLDAPGRLARFVDHPLYRTVLAPRHGLLRTVSRANRLAAGAVAKVVGSDLLSEVVEFFALFDGMDRGFRDRAAATEALLAGSETAYVVVTSARHQAVTEAEWIADNLAARGRAIDLLVVNRVLPPHFRLDTETDPSRLPSAIRANLARLSDQVAAEQALARDLAEAIAARHRCAISQQRAPVADLAGIGALARQLVD